ncbi:MAG: NADH-quinone oxidoreductase subunit K, partial [Methanomicrobia archaeon]|nr:NADH-quinone oxidoreductase subunit K [Methanomicrobia archaeon]
MEQGLVIGGNLIITLFLIHFVASMFAVELRNLRASVIAIAIQALFLALILFTFAQLGPNPTLYWWSLTALVTKVIIIPYLLWIYVRRLPTSEVKPYLGTIPSVIILLAIVVAFYSYIHTNVEFITPTPEASTEPARMNLALSLTICALGVYVLLVKRDAIKVVIGLVLLENGVHLSLVTLAPSLPETAIIGIVTNVIITVWLLLYLS